MSLRQANIFTKRFEKLQRWEQGNWMMLNFVFALVAFFSKIQHQPAMLWLLAVLVLFLGPRMHKEFQKKQRITLESNIVNLPADWDKHLSIFTRLAGWNFFIVLGFGLTYLLPQLYAYVSIGLLYLVSWILQWKTIQKRREVRTYLSQFKPLT